MGKKTDFVLRRNSRYVTKLKELASLVISRSAILKKHHLARFSHARSDVIQLLNLGHQHRALLRVEHVIKEQNMLDVFAMIENYCDLLMEKAKLFPKNSECPEEMKEAINSLIFAASRCGEFPEIQQIRETFTTRFGKEFATEAVELRNNCEVNTKMIQKLTSRQASYANRWEVLEQIASENGMVLRSEDEHSSVITEEKEVNQKMHHQQQIKPTESPNLKDSEDHVEVSARNIFDKIMLIEELSESMIARSVSAHEALARSASAQEALARSVSAQEAFASAPARAPSRSESRDEDLYDCHDSENQQETALDYPILQIGWYESSEDSQNLKKETDFEKIHPVESFSSESEGQETREISEKTQENSSKTEPEGEKATENSRKTKRALERFFSASSVELSDDKNEAMCSEIIFEESENEIEEHEDDMKWLEHDPSSDKKTQFLLDEIEETTQYNAVVQYDLSNDETDIRFDDTTKISSDLMTCGKTIQI